MSNSDKQLTFLIKSVHAHLEYIELCFEDDEMFTRNAIATGDEGWNEVRRALLGHQVTCSGSNLELLNQSSIDLRRAFRNYLTAWTVEHFGRETILP
jgi:hypothetical protein